MAWVARLRVPAHVDEALDVWIEAGADAVEFAGDDEILGLFHVVEPEGLRQTLRDGLRRAGIEGEPVLEPATLLDWDSVWALTWRPFRVGPLTFAPDGEPSEERLVIEAGDAFGTGLHPSTRLCLQQLVAHRPEGALLDVGTGTGILALAALRLGARRAVGVDTDRGAVEVARRNAARNGLADRFVVEDRLVDAIPDRFERVVANLLGAPLMRMAASLARRVASSGELSLAGFPEGQADEVAAPYVRLGMRRVTVEILDGWARVDLRATW